MNSIEISKNKIKIPAGHLKPYESLKYQFLIQTNNTEIICSKIVSILINQNDNTPKISLQ